MNPDRLTGKFVEVPPPERAPIDQIGETLGLCSGLRTHECKKVGQISGSNSVGFDSNGQMITTYIPGKTGYACSDGVPYWR